MYRSERSTSGCILFWRVVPRRRFVHLVEVRSLASLPGMDLKDKAKAIRQDVKGWFFCGGERKPAIEMKAGSASDPEPSAAPARVPAYLAKGRWYKSESDKTPLLPDTAAKSEQQELPSQPLRGHTFTFRVGTIRPTKSNRWVDVVNTCLPGKVVNFRCSTKHESIYVDGLRHGGRAGRLLESTTLGKDGRIETLTIGLSTSSLRNDWGGGMVANFNNCTVSSGGECRAMAVEAEMIAPNKMSWTYNRKKLGLELWLTGVSLAQTRAADEVPIAYTFTLTSPNTHDAAQQGLDFNEDEFRTFWDWLTLIRQCEVSNRLPMQLLLDAAAEGTMAAGGAGLGAGLSAGAAGFGAGLKVGAAGLNAGTSLGGVCVRLADKATCGVASTVASKATQVTSDVAAVVVIGARAAEARAKAAASATAASASTVCNATTKVASSATSAACSGVKAGGSLGGQLAVKLVQQAQSGIFKGEKPAEEESGEAEVGQDVTKGDRDYHIARSHTHQTPQTTNHTPHTTPHTTHHTPHTIHHTPYTAHQVWQRRQVFGCDARAETGCQKSIHRGLMGRLFGCHRPARRRRCAHPLCDRNTGRLAFHLVRPARLS